MPRAFYDCPLKAAYMAKYFGMQYSGGDSLVSACEAVGRDAEDMKTMPFYIHPDSMRLLEPQKGDLIIHRERIRCLDKLGTVAKITKDKQLFIEADYMDDGGAHEGNLVHRVHISKAAILQRDGLPFFWPEFEEGESA